jgi:glycosyltransferase involved in cell wall biosynthesis
MPPTPGKPLITLITVVRNGAAHIEHALQSVQAQGYPNLRYIVMDGASTDGTQAIVERYRPLLHTFISRPDKGAYDATQQAFALAEGDIVGLLHADDWLAPDALSTLAQMHADDPLAEIFCFAMQEHRQQPDGGTRPTRIFRDPPGKRFGLSDALYCHGVNRFYSGETIRRFGQFNNARYVQMADRDMYMRMGEAGLRKAWTDKVLYHFLVHPQSNSTGGDLGKTIYFLKETAQIAQDWLARETPPGSQLATRNSHLINWYCFNQLRVSYFLLKAGRVREMLGLLRALFTRYPLRTMRNILCWKMPKAYRPARG